METVSFTPKFPAAAALSLALALALPNPAAAKSPRPAAKAAVLAKAAIAADSATAAAAAGATSPAAQLALGEAAEDTITSEAAPAAIAPAAPAEPADIAPAPTPAPEAAAAKVPEASLPERIAGWERNQLGVTIQGTTSSRFIQSSIGGKSATINQPTHENLAYSRADVQFTARPSTSTYGKLDFRLHQDWENYYDEGPNPLLARWFEFGGTIWDEKIKFGFGDFHGNYSPLTLYSPGLALPNEPEIFAARRQMAMDEWHLDGSGLPLQGFHADYSDRITPGFSLSAGAIASRLRTGASSTSTWLYWTDDVEKLMGAGYLKAEFFGGLEAGVSRIQIVDPVKTSRALNNEYVQHSPTAMFEDVTVNAASLSYDAKNLVQAKPIALKLGVEFAQSTYMPAHDRVDTTGFYTTQEIVDQAGTVAPVRHPILGLLHVQDTELKDDALRATLHAGWRETETGPLGLSLDAAFLRNGKDYVNDVAQSPEFLGRRILNSANQVKGFGGYNTFDALYNHVYTVDPVTSANTSEWWATDTKTYNGTNNWFRAPQFKNSYTNVAMTRSERVASAGALDPQLQMLYPYGPATPNRQGIDAALSAKILDGKIEAGIQFASLKEQDGHVLDSATAAPGLAFGRIGAGVKVQAGQWLGWDKRITVSAGYLADNAKQAAYSYKDTAYAEANVKSALLNAGLYANVWKGLSFLAGYQQIKSNPYRGYTVAGKTKTADQADLTQGNWAVGLEYRIAAGVYATAEYGAISLDEAKSATAFSQKLVSGGLVVGF